MNEENTIIEVKISTVSVTGEDHCFHCFKGRRVAFIRNYKGTRSHHDQHADKSLYHVGKDKYVVLVEEWTRTDSNSDFSLFHPEDSELLTVTMVSERQVAKLFPDLAKEAGLECPIELNLPEVE